VHLRFCSDGFIKLYAKGEIHLKKFTKLALTGALALGALAGVGSFDAKPAAAAEKTVQYASNPADSWGITNTAILYEHIKPMPAEYKTHLMSAYKTSNYFTILVDNPQNLVAGKDQVKIFRVSDDGKGELSRYKTIDFHTESALPGKAIFDTQITDNYLPGTYVAVSYINGVHLKSDFFTINK